MSSSVSDENKQCATVTERALCGKEAVGALLFVITHTHTHAYIYIYIYIYIWYLQLCMTIPETNHIFRVFNVAAILWM
jgi:hypothetical protein